MTNCASIVGNGMHITEWTLTRRYKDEEKGPHENTLFLLLCPISSASDIFSTFESDPQMSSKLKIEDFWNLETKSELKSLSKKLMMISHCKGTMKA